MLGLQNGRPKPRDRHRSIRRRGNLSGTFSPPSLIPKLGTGRETGDTGRQEQEERTGEAGAGVLISSRALFHATKLGIFTEHLLCDLFAQMIF